MLPCICNAQCGVLFFLPFFKLCFSSPQLMRNRLKHFHFVADSLTSHELVTCFLSFALSCNRLAVFVAKSFHEQFAVHTPLHIVALTTFEQVSGSSFSDR